MNMVEYTEFIVKSICKQPDMVKITFSETEEGMEVLILVDNVDKPALIGKGGSTVKSISTLLRTKSYIEKGPYIKVSIDSIN